MTETALLTRHMLGLKLRVLAHTFRRDRWHLVAVALGLLVAAIAVVLLIAALAALAESAPAATAWHAYLVGGVAVSAGFLVVPVLTVLKDPLDPRALGLLGMPVRPIAVALGVAALVSLPILMLAVLVVAAAILLPGEDGGNVGAALAAGLLGLVAAALSSRVATSFAALALLSRRAREFAGLIGVFLLIMASPVIVYLLTVDWRSRGPEMLARVADVLAFTPWGAPWAVAEKAAEGDVGGSLLAALVAVLWIALLAAAWWGIVAVMLTRPERAVLDRGRGGLGWFDTFPTTPTGAVAARSLTYWTRDPRYLVSLLGVFIVPAVMVLALPVAGVPVSVVALLPLPVMSLIVGFAVHNDVAYDGSAVWLHVVSNMRGLADRIGRLVPVLLLGVPLIGVGSWISAMFYGSWQPLPGLLGVCTALFLSALGIGSYLSARLPYPAPRPGDSPFTQPQAIGGSAITAQVLTVLGAILVSVPTIALAVLGLAGDPELHMSALGSGIATGAIMLVVGVGTGAWAFSQRGPEIMAVVLRS